MKPHTSSIDDRIRFGDRTFVTIPMVGDLTYNELHALTLGLLGFLIATQPFAVATVRREPHYFVVTLVGSYLLGRWLRLHNSR